MSLDLSNTLGLEYSFTQQAWNIDSLEDIVRKNRTLFRVRHNSTEPVQNDYQIIAVSESREALSELLRELQQLANSHSSRFIDAMPSFKPPSE